jgi:hypothetical protein
LAFLKDNSKFLNLWGFPECYNSALFSSCALAHFIQYQAFSTKIVVTPSAFDFLVFSCWYQSEGITFQVIGVSFNSDFDSTSSIRRDDACCFYR